MFGRSTNLWGGIADISVWLVFTRLTYVLPAFWSCLSLSIFQWDDLFCHTTTVLLVQNVIVTVLVLGDHQQTCQAAGRNVLPFPFALVPPQYLKKGFLGFGYEPAGPCGRVMILLPSPFHRLTVTEWNDQVSRSSSWKGKWKCGCWVQLPSDPECAPL